MGDRLNGKAAIITGAASGIGAATARRFHAEGASVLIVDRSGEDAAALAHSLDPSGQQVRAVTADVQDEAALRACVAAALDAWGRLDIVVNNAGVPSRMPLEELTPEEIDRVIGVNLKGPLLMCKHAVPVMQRGGGGAIVNVASISSTCGIPGQFIYAPSKGALAQMTRQLAVEYASHNIRVNAVAPGTIDTPMLRQRGQRPGPAKTLPGLAAGQAPHRPLRPARRSGQRHPVPGLRRGLLHHRRQPGRRRRLRGAVIAPARA